MGYNIAGDFGTERKLLFLMSFVFVIYIYFLLNKKKKI